MTATPKRSSRWMAWVAVVFLLQLSFIFWLSDYSEAKVRKPSPAPILRLAGNEASEILSLSDPTLFALPHFRGFSGRAWLSPPSAPNHWFEWRDEARWLTVAPEDFPHAKDIAQQTREFDAFEFVNVPEPESAGIIVSVPSQFRQRSELRLHGDLARQALKSYPELPAWASTNLITNTIVGVTINSEGLPISITVLGRSGLAEADDFALKTARNLRFESRQETTPKPNPPPSAMISGELVFQWRGVPVGQEEKR